MNIIILKLYQMGIYQMSSIQIFKFGIVTFLALELFCRAEAEMQMNLGNQRKPQFL